MKYGLVVDLGATNLRVAIVNDNHEVIRKEKTSLDKNRDIASNIYNLYKKMNMGCKLESIVVGVAGSIDYKNNMIRDLPNLKIKQYNLKEALYKLFEIDVTIINDASLAALGEYSLHKEQNIFEYITLSSGIGGGLVNNGKLFTGNNGFEQEIGRMEIKGKKFEELCSGNALKNRLLSAGIDEEYPSTALISKNEKYVKVVDEWLDDLSIGIANIIRFVNPSMIVFGGGIGIYCDYFKEKLLNRLKNSLPIDVVEDLKIEKSHYLDDSGLIGGSYLIFQDK